MIKVAWPWLKLMCLMWIDVSNVDLCVVSLKIRVNRHSTCEMLLKIVSDLIGAGDANKLNFFMHDLNKFDTTHLNWVPCQSGEFVENLVTYSVKKKVFIC
jgi:hypothetical protein